MPAENKDTKICPWCGEEIKSRALICRFCFQDVTHGGVEAAERFAETRGTGAAASPPAPSAPSPPRKKGRPAAKAKAAEEPSHPDISRLKKYVPKNVLEDIITGAETLEEGERRPIAVLFSDLAGFTSLTEELGAEWMSDLLDEIYAATREIIAQYGGVVDKFIGDAVMAIFGAPVAHGDDPERAIRAALDIREAVRRIGREKGYELDTHGGIAYGEVVLKTSQSGAGLDLRTIGDAVNLASRLEGRAPTGHTYVDHRIFLQTRVAFEWEDLAPIEVKGKKDPVKVHRPVEIKKQYSKIALGERIELTPLVGREEEMRVLAEAAESASSGRETLLQVRGEAGVGKSRLVYEFYHTLDRERYYWFTGRALSFGQNVPFLPFTNLVRSILGLPRESGPILTPELLKERLTALLQPVGEDVRRSKKSKSVPRDSALIEQAIAILLSLNLPANPLLSLPPRERRLRIYEAMASLLMHLSQRKTMILVFEDFHWADDDSLDLADYLLEKLAARPILFLILARPEFRRSFPAVPVTRHLDLNLLSDEDSRALLCQILGMDRIPADLCSLILKKTQGNPFYVEEVVLNLEDQDVIEKKGGAYRLKKDISEIIIPDSVENVVLARLDCLEKTLKRILQCASVIGQEFRYQTLVHVSEISAELRQCIVSLVEEDYLFEEMLIPELIYIFRHIILRDVTYGTLLEKRKRYFHARVARAIENIYENNLDEHLELIAHHYERGGIYDQAVNFLEKAARKCEGLYAQRAAADHWERLLKALGPAEIPEDQKYPVRLRASLALGELCRRLGRPNRGAECFSQAIEDARLLKNQEAEARALCGLGEARRLAGDAESALVSVLAALPLAKKTGNDDLIMACHNMIGHMERNRGNFSRARGSFNKILEYARKTGDRKRLYQALNHLGILEMYAGKPAEAHDLFINALDLARELGMKNEQVQIALNIGINHIRRGEMREAYDCINTALAHADKIEFELGAQLCLLALGDLALKTGNYQNGLSLARRLINRMQESRFSDIMAMALTNRANALLGLGQIEAAWKDVEDAYAAAMMDQNYAGIVEAVSVKVELFLAQEEFDQALQWAERMNLIIMEHQELEHLGLAKTYLVRSLYALGRLEEAEKLAREACNDARKVAVPRDEAWATYNLARVLLKSGKTRQAEALLPKSLELAEKVGDNALITLLRGSK